MRVKQQQQATSLSTAEVRERLAEVINHVAYAKDRVILTRRKKPLAAVVPLEDVALLEAIEEKADLKALRAARREVKREGAIPWPRIKTDLKLG
ncbi:MAG: type II toxin-antitoxin system prevent-host-death family antitoxin [Candidatus Binataceae bacterium]